MSLIDLIYKKVKIYLAALYDIRISHKGSNYDNCES